MKAADLPISTKENIVGGVRTIFLVDIENICGMSNPSLQAVKNARRLILGVMSPNNPNDVFVLGCDPANASNVKRGFPQTSRDGSKVRFGIAKSGKDGGDRALIYWVENNLNDVSQWDRIVLCSGDHIFADLAKSLKKKGAKLYFITRTRKSTSEEFSNIISDKYRHYLEDICSKAQESLDAITEGELKSAFKKYSKEKWAKVNKRKRTK